MTFPVFAFLSFVRTIARQLPGETCWYSVMIHISLSSWIAMPLRNSDIEAMPTPECVESVSMSVFEYNTRRDRRKEESGARIASGKAAPPRAAAIRFAIRS
jgi:hypothetical protein